MRQKRVCALMLAAVVAAGVFTGCGDKKEADDREPHRPAHRNIRGKEYFAASIKQSTQNNAENGNKR